MFGLVGSCFEVDVGESIKLIDYDVNVIASNTSGLNCNSLAFVGAGDGTELAVTGLMFDLVEVETDTGNTLRVSDEDYFVGEKLRFEMEMEATSIGSDN